MATAFRYFPGKPIEWLKAKHDAILEQLAAAVQPTSATVGEVSVSGASAQSLQATARQLYHDMSVLDSATYPRTNLARTVSRVSIRPL
jgi:uncharacterized membrane protein affecting hemolysin expression